MDKTLPSQTESMLVTIYAIGVDSSFYLQVFDRASAHQRLVEVSTIWSTECAIALINAI